MHSSSAKHSAWYRSEGSRVHLDNEHGKEVAGVEFWSTFYMVQNWELSTSSGNSTWYGSGCCRGLLDILECTEAGDFEICTIFYMYVSGCCSVLLNNLEFTLEDALVFCSTLYVVYNWAPSISVRHFTWYRIGSCLVLLDIIHGTEVGAVESCSTLYMVQNWPLASSARHSS